jgi:serine/threonine protein kinase
MTPGFKLLDKFVFHELLDSGGMGEIWLATYLASDTKVAIKISKNSLEIEFKNSSLVQHVYFCKAFEYIHFEDNHYLVLDYLEGLNLSRYNQSYSVENEKIQFSKSIYVANKVLEALRHLHNLNLKDAKKILHRDIKPSNIFITKKNEIKLIDLGTSILINNGNTKTVEALIVTRKYSSPDLWEQDEYRLDLYEECHDIYSTGLVFVEMCNLKYDDDFNFLNEDLLRFRKFLNKWIHPEKTKRFSSAGEVISELDFFVKKYEFVGNFFDSNIDANNFKNKDCKIDLTLQVGVDKNQIKQVNLNKHSRQLKILFKALLIVNIAIVAILVFITLGHIDCSWFRLSMLKMEHALYLTIVTFVISFIFLLKKYIAKYSYSFKDIAPAYYSLLIQLLIQRKWHLAVKLKTIRKVLIKYNFKKKKIDQIRSNLNYVSQKSKNKNLKLGLIGEFSSGKSTLINAIIGYDLLKTSPLPTTTISNSVTYSKKKYIEVLKNKTDPHRKEYFDTYNSEIEKIINDYTSGEISNDFRVKIGVNSVFLKEGFELLDTPGANSLNPEHRDRALYTIKNDADFIIVLIKATQPLSLSLQKLIKEITSASNVDFAFVITSIDLIPEIERSRLLTNIKTRIKESIGCDEIKIYPISASKRLDSISNKNSEDENSEYNRLFNYFLNDLKRFLLIGRKEIIENRIKNSIEELKLSITESLENKIYDLKTKKSFFNEIVIKDIEDFKRNLQNDFIIRASNAAKILTATIEGIFTNSSDEFIKSIETSIINSKDNAALNTAIEKINEMLKNQIASDMSLSYKKIHEIMDYEKMVIDSEQDFWKRYNKLKEFNPQLKNENIDILFNVQVDIKDDLSKLSGEVYAKGGIAFTAGAATGAAIGSMLLPGFGTVVGGILGAVIGALAGGPSLAELKVQYLANTKPLIKSQYSQVIVIYKDTFNNHNQKIIKKFMTRTNDLLNLYQEAIERINKQINIEKTNLEKEENIIREDIKEMERIL